MAESQESTEGPDIHDQVESAVDVSVPEPYGCYAFAAHDPRADIARYVERAVFLEAFGNTREMLREEYDPYESTSVFLCVVDHRRRLPAGAVRLILPSETGPGFKSANDIEPAWNEPGISMFRRAGVPIGTSSLWDIATLAVSPEYQHMLASAGLVSLGLYQSGVRAAVDAGIDWMIALLDVVVYRMSRLKFRNPFVPCAEGRPYLGSASSLPVYLHISDWKQRVLSTDRSIHDVIFDASGIEAAVRPLDIAAHRSLFSLDQEPESSPTSSARSARPESSGSHWLVPARSRSAAVRHPGADRPGPAASTDTPGASHTRAH